MNENTSKICLPDESEEPLTAAVSSGDMTGLIPCGLTEAEQIDSYCDVYPYLADENDCADVHNAHKIKK